MKGSGLSPKLLCGCHEGGSSRGGGREREANLKACEVPASFPLKPNPNVSLLPHKQPHKQDLDTVPKLYITDGENAEL